MRQFKLRPAVLAAAAFGAWSVCAHGSITGFGSFAAVNSNVTSSTIGYGGSIFTLTDGGSSEAVSGFSATPQSITSFQAHFTYTVPGGPRGLSQFSQADGFTFIIENDPRGTAAVGGIGGDKGYRGTNGGATPIANSAAVGYEFYDFPTFNESTNGASYSNRSVGFQIANGDPVQVTVNYVGTTLTTSFFDPDSKNSFVATNTGVNLQSLLGSSTGYIGFGGGTGGAASTQKISNFVFNNAPQVYKPIAISGFNQDMVIENTAPASGAAANITATMDAGTAKTGATFYEQGYNSTAPATGLPASGSAFTSQADPNHSFTMGNYSANNAVLLTPTNTSATIAFTTPLAYTSLSLLTSCGNDGVAAVNVTINFADGAPSITIPYDSVSPNWFFQGPPAWDAQGRAYPGSGGTTYDNVNNNEPNLYEDDIAMPDSFDPISSITLGYDATAGNLAIFAVSGAVPEPTTMGLIAVGAIGLLGRRSRRR